jgi:hypothetical protein
MTLTVSYHTQLPENHKEWTFVDKSYKQSRYTQVMSCCARLKIIIGIVVKTIFTFGMYYFIYMRCSANGKMDLENLKKHVFVHYVAHEKTKVEEEEDQNETISDDVAQQKHKEQLERNKKRAQDDPEVIINLTDILKIYKKKVDNFRKISSDIKEIIKTKKEHFLDLIAENETDLTTALHKFLKLEESKQTNYNFMRLLSSFLKKEDLSKILNDALDKAKSASDKKTIYHEAFEQFQSAYRELGAKKIEWLISIQQTKLCEFILPLLELGDQYTPQFRSLYDSYKGLWQECLESMQKDIPCETKTKELLGENFTKWKEIDNQLQKNIAADITDNNWGVHYTLLQQFGETLQSKGFNEELRYALAPNEMSAAFVCLFSSPSTDEVYKQIEELLKDDSTLKKAQAKCKEEIEKAKIKNEEAEKQIKQIETKDAFKKMKKCFIDQKDYNDAITSFVDMGLLLETNDLNLILFFNFVRTIKDSPFFVKGSKAICDIEFYEDFHPYFQHLDLCIGILEKWMKKIEWKNS